MTQGEWHGGTMTSNGPPRQVAGGVSRCLNDTEVADRVSFTKRPRHWPPRPSPIALLEARHGVCGIGVGTRHLPALGELALSLGTPEWHSTCRADGGASALVVGVGVCQNVGREQSESTARSLR